MLSSSQGKLVRNGENKKSVVSCKTASCIMNELFSIRRRAGNSYIGDIL